jgi:hypothetical protein
VSEPAITITIPVAEYDHLLEIKASAEGLFQFLLIKPDPGQDVYVGWSDGSEGPNGIWTREQALAEGCPASRLRRADETGTSAKGGTYGWACANLIAEQRGLLRRERLLPYSELLLAGRKQEAFDLLDPFEYETEVRRG